MKGKLLATTLCITGLAIISLPVNHVDASWATQYLKNNGYGDTVKSGTAVVSKEINKQSPNSNTYYSYYYYRQHFNSASTASQTNVTVHQSKDMEENYTNETNYNISQDEAYMLQLINDERTKIGLNKLTMDNDLARLAKLKSEDMVTNNYFNHESPTYGSPYEMMKDNGISYSMAAENIAKNSSVYKAHVSLMNSDGHKANILNPGYDKVGIGIVKGQNNTYIITQMFIKE